MIFVLLTPGLTSEGADLGEPDVDYPIMASTQETSFTCDGLIFGGYYADQEARCQQYHVCLQVTIGRS